MKIITAVQRQGLLAMSAAVLLGVVVCTAAADVTAGQSLTAVTPARIMALGDSITRGSGATWGEGYRLSLTRRMLVGLYTSDMVGLQNSGPPWLYDRNHEGYGGYGIDDLTRVVAAELNTYQPDYVLLMVGSNDVQWDYQMDTAPERLSGLIDLITATRPSAHLVVASITPLKDSVMDARARVYNGAIPGIVAAKAASGRRVSFLDLYPLLSLDDLRDNVHPNDSGYTKLAAAWAGELVSIRPAPAPVSGRTCPCSMWGAGDGPTNLQVSTTTSAEVGVKFRPDKDGVITAVRFYKGPDNSGPHEARLWSAISDSSTYTWDSTTMSGTLLANGTVTSGSSSGWQEVAFPTPVPVQAHRLYFASYYAPFGRYSADPGYFRDREIVHSPLRLPSQGSIDGNGFIRIGSPGLPQPSPQGDTNYWVDVVFLPNSPAFPATVTATAVSAGQINTVWSAVADATGYRVERSLDSTNWSALATVPPAQTSYSDTGLTPATRYHYRLVAISNGVESTPSGTATATTESLPPPAAPDAPSTVTATAASSTQINVAWSSVSSATAYRVERATVDTGWTSVATTSADVLVYSDTGLQAASTYSYRIVASNAGGDSPASAVATARTDAAADTLPPTAPTGLKASSPKGKVNLSWTGSTDSGGSGLAGYTVWRSTTGASGSFIAVGTSAVTSYSDAGVTSREDYWYRVTASDGAGNRSQPSNVVSAQPK